MQELLRESFKWTGLGLTVHSNVEAPNCSVEGVHHDSSVVCVCMSTGVFVYV